MSEKETAADQKEEVLAADVVAEPKENSNTLEGIRWQFKDEFDFTEAENAAEVTPETDAVSEHTELINEEILADSEVTGDQGLLEISEAIAEPEMSEEAIVESILEADMNAAAESADESISESTSESTAEKASDNDLPFEFVDTERFYSIIESLLFSYDKPVSISLMREAFRGTNIKSKDISKALDILASRFAASDRGVMLEEIAGGYQLRTKPDNAQFLLRMTKERPFKLTGPSLETLSIVAYKQPIVKSELDQIRGVESGHLLRALMDRGLVNFQGKSELPGKPMQYGTTRKFLEIFGLRNLKELPSLVEIDQLIPEGIGDPEDEKQNLSDLTDEMSTVLTGTYSEGETELIQITDQLSEIHTSSEFFENEKKREKEKRERERAEDIAESLMLGTPVEDKDLTWLKRYEQKQAELVLQAEEKAKAELAGASAGASVSEEALLVAKNHESEEHSEDTHEIEDESHHHESEGLAEF